MGLLGQAWQSGDQLGEGCNNAGREGRGPDQGVSRGGQLLAYFGSKAKKVSWWTGWVVGEKERSLRTPGWSAAAPRSLEVPFAEKGKTAGGADLGESGDWHLGLDTLCLRVCSNIPVAM